MNTEKITSFFYLKIFIFFFVALIIGASIAKVASEIATASFKYNTMVLLYVSKDSKIIVVDKLEKKATFIAVGDIRKFVKGKSTLEASIALGIPISGMVIDDSFTPYNLKDFTTFKTEMRLLVGSGITYKNANRYDMHTIINAARSAIEDNREELRINLFGSDKKKIDEYFRDSVVHNTPYTIEIDNGTTVDGLGSSLATILSNVGFNVIAVRTVNSDESSYISYGDMRNSYVDELIHLTGFEYKKEKVSKAADITIHLGSDLDILLNQ